MPAAAKKAKSRKTSGNSRQPPAPLLRDRVAARLQGLAAEAQCSDIAEGAGDPELAGETVYRLLAHQLASGHTLAVTLGAHTHRLLGAVQAGGGEDGGRQSAETLRFAAGTARLMERCRSAALALERIGFPEMPEAEPEDDDPSKIDHPDHYDWRLSNARKRERRCVLDWLAQGKKVADLPGVEAWPQYHNPRPDLEKIDEWLAPLIAEPLPSAQAVPALRRGRLKNGNPSGDYMTAPRCGAHTRAATRCRQPAMRNGRCRFHGGKSTGPRTAEGLERARTARRSHGCRSAEIIDLRSAAARIGRNLRGLARAARGLPPLSRQREKSPLPLAEREGSFLPEAIAQIITQPAPLDMGSIAQTSIIRWTPVRRSLLRKRMGSIA
jgi:hypothetical protein